MGDDRERWNAKYEDRGDALRPPVPFILEHIQTLPPGSRLLDLGAGDGRHAIPLAREGYVVTAVDVSDVGLERLDAFATAAGVQVETVQRDLEQDDALNGLGPFEGALISFYKPPPWQWHPLARAIPPDGKIVLATFNHHHATRTGFPKRFTLEDDELLHPHPGMELVVQQRFDEEDRSYDGYVWVRA